MKSFNIKTKRLILRSLRRSDFLSIAKNAHNKIIAQNTLRMPYPYTKKDAQIFIEKIIKASKKKKRENFAFGIEKDGNIVGVISLNLKNEFSGIVGYWIGKDYWGQGLITEALKAITKFGFEKLRLKRIYAYVFPWNKASMAVLKKNGYKLEGILRKRTKHGGKFVDDYIFAKVK